MTSTALDTVQSSAALAIQAGQVAWDPMQLAALAQLGIKDASDGDKSVFLHQCQRTGLDPFARQIYMIGRNEKKNERRGNAWVDTWTVKWTIQTGIEGWRVIRDRAERRVGVRGILSRFVYYDTDGKEHKVWVQPRPPVACEVTYTVIEASGREVPYTSVLRFNEYVQLKDGNAIAQWATKPTHMLEKCTEADVYRRAFPQDFSGIDLDDAMPPHEAAAAAPPRGRVTAGEVLEHRDASAPQPQAAAERPAAAVPDEQPASGPAAATGPLPPLPSEEVITAPVSGNTAVAGEAAHADATGPGAAGPDLATTGQAGIIARHFKRLGFTDDERDERLGITSEIAGRGVNSTKELTQDEAKTVADTLSRCKDRGQLVVLAGGAKAEGSDG